MDQNWRKRQAEKKRNEETLDAPGVEVDVVTESTVLEGHGDWINALGISRDEKRLISGDDKSLSIVWDLSSQKEVARWSGYPVDWVTSAALTPDGKTAFTAEYTSSRGSFDRPPAQARFWNADSGEMKLDVLAIQFPDDKRENSYGYGKKWGQFMGRGFVCADISPDGKLLAVGQGGETGKGQIHLIEVETGKVARTVADHRYGVCDVKFSDDGKYVLSTGRDTTLEIDQVSDGKEIARLGESRGGQFKDWLDGLAISPDSQWVAAADIAGIVQVWRSEG